VIAHLVPLGTPAALIPKIFYTPKDSARLPFSIRFFLISIVFLIFDVELILIFPAIPGLISILYQNFF
jgi:NADH:ubiquinone oxidoreductase subunit 3 (subunit A)